MVLSLLRKQFRLLAAWEILGFMAAIVVLGIGVSIAAAILIMQARHAQIVFTETIQPIRSVEFPSMGLVVVEAQFDEFSSLSKPSLEIPDHDFSFSQTLSMVSFPHGGTFATALIVRPTAGTFNTGPSQRLDFAWGYSSSSIAWRIWSFQLPFAFAEHMHTVDPAGPADIECLHYHSGMNGCPHCEWQTCPKIDNGSFTFNTGNWSWTDDGFGKFTKVQKNPSWPRGNFFLVSTPLTQLEEMRQKIEAGIGSWVESVTENSNSCAQVNSPYMCYRPGMLTDMSLRLQNSAPGGMWVNLSTDATITVSSTICKGVGCVTPLEANLSMSAISASKSFAAVEPNGFFYDDLTIPSPAHSTRLAVDQTQKIIRGSVSFTYTSAIANIVSYAHTGYSAISYFYPSMISFAFMFKFGPTYKAYTEALEMVGMQQSLSERLGGAAV